MCACNLPHPRLAFLLHSAVTTVEDNDVRGFLYAHYSCASDLQQTAVKFTSCAEKVQKLYSGDSQKIETENAIRAIESTLGCVRAALHVRLWRKEDYEKVRVPGSDCKEVCASG